MHLAHDVTMSILGAHVEAIHLFLHLKPYLFQASPFGTLSLEASARASVRARRDRQW